MSRPSTRLVVFADHWGGHPSSCQHLISQILDVYPTLWVNTIGTRRPRLTRDDVHKAARYLADARRTRRDPRLTVIQPPMWPGFRTRWQRQINATMISRSVNRALGPRRGERRIALTTLPVTADLIGRIDVDEWVYYCVDEFWTWPELDQSALQQMDKLQVGSVDRLIAASTPLQRHLARLGRRAPVLSHGVDVEHWRTSAHALPAGLATARRPIWMFWGLLDGRLDVDWCQALAGGKAGAGTLVLVGPGSAPRPLRGSVLTTGAVSYRALPAFANAADVLVLPYADRPVTRAAQPLKLKEYLATSKPVVARDLPATRVWSDAADIVETAADFIEIVRKRSLSDTPAEQLLARRRLLSESWVSKARAFEQLLLGSAA